MEKMAALLKARKANATTAGSRPGFNSTGGHTPQVQNDRGGEAGKFIYMN